MLLCKTYTDSRIEGCDNPHSTRGRRYGGNGPCCTKSVLASVFEPGRQCPIVLYRLFSVTILSWSQQCDWHQQCECSCPPCSENQGSVTTQSHIYTQHFFLRRVGTLWIQRIRPCTWPRQAKPVLHSLPGTRPSSKLKRQVWHKDWPKKDQVETLWSHDRDPQKSQRKLEYLGKDNREIILRTKYN